MREPLLDAKEVARELRISRAAAYREMHLMPHVIVGSRSIRVTEAAFEAYLKRRTVDPWGPTRHRVSVRKVPTSPSVVGSDDDDLGGPEALMRPPLRIVYPRTKPRHRP